MRSRVVSLWFLLALVMLGLLPATVHAQAAGSVLANCTVQLRSTVTGQLSASTMTNATGSFSFAGLPTGQFTVEAVSPTGQIIGTSPSFAAPAAGYTATGLVVSATTGVGAAGASAGGAQAPGAGAAGGTATAATVTVSVVAPAPPPASSTTPPPAQNAPTVVKELSLSTSRATSKVKVVVTVTLSQPAPAGGFSVPIKTKSSSHVVVDAAVNPVIVPAGSTSVSVVIKHDSVATETRVTILTATSPSVSTELTLLAEKKP